MKLQKLCAGGIWTEIRASRDIMGYIICPDPWILGVILSLDGDKLHLKLETLQF